MTVALLRNKETDAARIVCAADHVGSWITDQRGGGPTQGSIKVTALTIRRENKYVLNLKRSKYLWARLVFSDFESRFPENTGAEDRANNFILKRYGSVF